jgi:acetylornithine deacetylase/succinyl-diaminopimelate desuccinylase-like protein
VGTAGVYNITADYGQLGIEIRPIPEDDVAEMVAEVERWSQEEGMEVEDLVMENGIICDPMNPYLQMLLKGIHAASGTEPLRGRKLAGTSARFAPGGNGVVWGQSGIGPHTSQERHFIPSIQPYYQALECFGWLTCGKL